MQTSNCFITKRAKGVNIYSSKLDNFARAFFLHPKVVAKTTHVCDMWNTVQTPAPRALHGVHVAMVATHDPEKPCRVQANRKTKKLES